MGGSGGGASEHWHLVGALIVSIDRRFAYARSAVQAATAHSTGGIRLEVITIEIGQLW